MRDRLRAHLELIRVFLTPTAVADSAAGFIAADSLAQPGGDASTWHALLAAAVSVCVYWLGMALNDVFDRRKDAASSPSKPIPSGRVTLRGALALSAVLAALALGIGGGMGVPCVVAGLLAAVLAYDSGGKNVPVLGNVLMGICRGGNFLLGAAAAEGQAFALSSLPLLLAAGGLCAFIALVTAVSRLEEEPFSLKRLKARALWTFAAPLALYAVRPADPWAAANSALLAGLLADALRSSEAAGLSTNARFHGAAVFVRKALAGIFLVDAGLVIALLPASAPRAPVALLFYALFGLAWIWKREWLSRGSQGS